jgi:hypothetical protein
MLDFKPEPYSHLGFAAGVFTIAWSEEPPFEIGGRVGLVRTAEIIACHTRAARLPTGVVCAALVGLVVRDPDLKLVRITGVERFCTMTQGEGSKLGLLVLTVEES